MLAFVSLCTSWAGAWATSESVALAGTLETIAGAAAVYQLPASKPRGVLFLAHGCNHRATDFWPQSSTCGSCVGLPEEVRITQDALDAGDADSLSIQTRAGRPLHCLCSLAAVPSRQPPVAAVPRLAGLAVVAISSSDEFSRCWHFDADGPTVKRALAQFVAAHGLAHLPLSALGASSGGAFVLQLPQLVHLHAVVSQIMAIPPAMLGGGGGGRAERPFPPTLFVHMKRDEHTATMAKRCIRKLKADGVSASEIEHAPLRVTARLFSERIRGLAVATAERLHRALLDFWLLDADGFLLHDPRRSGWREAIAADAALARALPGLAPGEPDTLQPDESPVAEVLNVAWAMHEIMSDHNRATLQWILHAGQPKTELELRA